MDRIESRKQPKGLSAKTVRNINQVISSAMDFAKEQKLITSNPTDGCALPRLEHKEMKTLPVSDRRADFTGQRSEYAAQSVKTGRAAESAFPRLAPPVCQAKDKNKIWKSKNPKPPF